MTASSVPRSPDSSDSDPQRDFNGTIALSCKHKWITITHDSLGKYIHVKKDESARPTYWYNLISDSPFHDFLEQDDDSIYDALITEIC